MKRSNCSKARALTLIPIIALAATVICMALAAILEGPTNKGALYTIFAFLGLMIIFLLPLPCLVISVIGTVFAVKAGKEGAAGAKKFLVLGIMETLACAAGTFLAILLVIAGQGV